MSCSFGWQASLRLLRKLRLGKPMLDFLAKQAKAATPKRVCAKAGYALVRAATAWQARFTRGRVCGRIRVGR